MRSINNAYTAQLNARAQSKGMRMSDYYALAQSNNTLPLFTWTVIFRKPGGIIQ